MTPSIKSFKDLVRQPTGTHMLDSGGAYGRHWQNPALPDKLILIESSTFRDKLEFTASINLASFLDRTLTIDKKMTRKLRALERKAGESMWSESAAEALAEALDWKVEGRADNAYNHENDLSQVFQYAVIVPKDCSDWLYSNDCYILIQSHNGCDVRGGYSDVLVCKPVGYDGNYDFLEWMIGWRFTEGTDSDGNALNESDLESLGQEYETGYASNPTYRFNEAIETVLSVESDSVTVKLKTGETVKAYAECRAEYVS
jgi:hypothetical protein